MSATALGMTNPKTLANMTATQLLQQVWRNESVLESVKPDVLLGNRDLVKPITVGDRSRLGMIDTFILDVTPENVGARNINLNFLKSLSMSPTEGNVQFIGNEGTFDLKWTAVYANDWAGGVTLQNFGIDARELKNYGVYKQTMKLLYQWRAEVLGYYMRQALCQRYSNNLTASPISLSLSYNHNFYVPSLADSAQPAYDSTASDHATAIGTALTAATTNSQLTVPYMLDLIDWAQNAWIEPATIAGRPMYLMLASPKQIKRLRDASVTNTPAYQYLTGGAIDDIKKVVPGTEFVIGNQLAIVEDRRAPTVTLSGNASAYTLSFGYEKAGRSTTRTALVNTGSQTAYYDANPLLGKMALVYYHPEKSHDEKQPDEYTQFEGKALFEAVGYCTPQWDLDAGSQTDTSAQQESSVIVLTRRT